MTTSRRHFLATVSALTATFCTGDLLAEAAAQTFFPHRPRTKAPVPPPFVYFGTDTTKPGARGIYVSRFDIATGKLTTPALATPSLRAAFFAVGQSRGRRMLYVCNEGDEHNSAITTYVIDPASGSLKQIGQVSSGAAGPAYISIDADGRSAYVADYAGSAIATYLIQPDGTLSKPVEDLDFKQPRFGHKGPNAERQDAAHPHLTLLSPDNRFLVVPDLGNDSIVTFPADASTGHLGTPHINERRPGSGPRHVAFHPNRRWIYCVNELDNHVDQLLWNETRGDAAHGVQAQALLTDTSRTVSTVDPGFHGQSTAAEVVIEGGGRHLYASNRGEDSIAVFDIDPANGALTLTQRISCGGHQPRQFTLDPTGKFLVCGNQASDSVTVFTRNETSGHLTGPIQTLPVPSPMMTLFA
jgi:6-phosphogluconolactonase